jgi:haloacetate dehalogenase
MSDTPRATISPFFPSLQPLDIEAGGVRFAGVIGGEGPPVLLLHGYPQTHITWRRIAPQLAKNHTLVIPDLPGYGASRTLAPTPRWTKRRVAEALVALMDSLNLERFAVVGHDRGARAGYRLAMDHPLRVSAFASLTVIPTLDAMNAMDFRAATRAFHWFFLAQEADLPERMLAVDPDAFIDRALSRMTGGREVIEPQVFDAYRTAFRDPMVRQAICEDYRAAMNEDLALDITDRESSRKMPCPVLVLWPKADATSDQPSHIEVWQRWASDVIGAETSGGHLQPEEAADEVLASLLPFLAKHTTSLG